MVFDGITPAPPDAILGLTEAFKKDPSPNKVNLGVGVYIDESGTTPILKSVRKAEQIILDQETTKSYLPISGSPEYGDHVQQMIFGKGHAVISAARCRTAHTPGGTGALRVGAELARKFVPSAKVWLSAPTWPNHAGVFAAAGRKIEEYPYYSSTSRGLDFGRMLDSLNKIPRNDIVVLHVCCHNPTGVDLEVGQWHEVARVAKQNQWIPFLDFAYQGLGQGLAGDRVGLLSMLETGLDCLIASSFSKNFGLYNERVGALTVVAKDSASAEAVFSHLKATVRVIYSNPPAHGGLIVNTIFKNPDLVKLWESEVDGMRNRIASVRTMFVDHLRKHGATMDFSFINRQRGMFSFSGLTDAQVKYLREKKSVYMVGGGRINVAGITSKNIDYLCDSIVEAMRNCP